MHANPHVPFLQRLWWRLQWCEVVCVEDIEGGQRWVVFNWFYFEWILAIVVLFICSPIDHSVHNFTVFRAVCIAIPCVPHSVYCWHNSYSKQFEDPPYHARRMPSKGKVGKLLWWYYYVHWGEEGCCEMYSLPCRIKAKGRVKERAKEQRRALWLVTVLKWGESSIFDH